MNKWPIYQLLLALVYTSKAAYQPLLLIMETLHRIMWHLMDHKCLKYPENSKFRFCANRRIGQPESDLLQNGKNCKYLLKRHMVSSRVENEVPLLSRKYLVVEQGSGSEPGGGTSSNELIRWL